MPVPKESLDLLLSGYLDDALSSEERRRVERWLQTDPDIVRELESLRSLRESVRAVARSDERTLGPEFADQVVEAAIARAQAEGLSEEHPLVRLAEQPTGAGVTKSRRTLAAKHVALLVAGLAASILIAVVALRPDEGDRRERAVAESTTTPEPGRETTEIDEILSPPRRPSDLAEEPPEMPVETVEPAHPSQLADDSASEAPDSEPVPDSLDDPTPSDPIDLRPPGEPSGAPMVADSDAESSTPEPPTSAKRLQALLVLDVRRTESGRASLAVRRAIDRADIGTSNDEGLDDEVVRAVTDEVELSDDSSGSVVYLEAPAKQLDQFVMSLIDDHDGIESVGWNIVFDVPVLNTVESIRNVDPTTVRHSTSRSVRVQDAEQREMLTGALGNREYLPVSGDQTPPLGELGAESSPSDDVPAQLLVLIR